ncbi:MAG: hypothetical protein NT027_20705 [Proteobacteria bacterium]|nr:hypothetical protein [Pseudomonadota bacterium]
MKKPSKSRPFERTPSKGANQRPVSSDQKRFGEAGVNRPTPGSRNRDNDKLARSNGHTPVYDPAQIPRPKRVPEGVDRKDEIKACGINACKAIFDARPNDIVRFYVTEELVKEFGKLLKYCAQKKKTYHIVSTADLAKISGSSHHEGVCMIAKARSGLSYPDILIELEATKSQKELVLILENVENPHNVGAIIRSAAHFGVKAIFAPNVDFFKPSASLLRTAEGGGEIVPVIGAPSMENLTKDLRAKGFKIIAADGQAKKSHLFSSALLAQRVAVIVGNEGKGLSPEARKLTDGVFAIPGTGRVESLNVSTAVAVICAEFWRTQRIQ